MAKIVIDANVMISAAFGGKPFEAVARALQEHDVFVSESIVEELERVIKKLSKKLSLVICPFPFVNLLDILDR